VKRRAENEAGFVLHTYPYKETSLIVEAFTRSFGRVSLLARGARRPRSALRGILLSFNPLRLSWSGGGSSEASLGTLLNAEWSGGWSDQLRPLAGQGLMCGFYVNELLLRLLPRDDPHEALFDHYLRSLNELSGGAGQAPVLRAFEKRLLAELGYAPLLDHDASSRPIEAERMYVYEPERGPIELRNPVRGSPSGDLVVSGRTLLDLARDDYDRAETRDEARALMRALIGERLHGQVLHTRAVLMELNDL
jgi:DNA repair protein RecO (recombination protein O)